MGWKAFLARVAVLCLALGVTMRVAMARDGEPGGRARSFITVAGTVTGVAAGDTMMRFTFRRTVSADGGVTEERCVRDVSVGVDAAGTFAAEVPLEVPGSVCEANFFDGSDVRVDVSIGGVMVVDGGAVNPVPYAIHADTAAAATRAVPDSGLDQRLAAASVVDSARVIVNGSTPQDASLSITGDATVGGTLTGHGADMLAYGAACLATGRGGRFVVEGTAATADLSCDTVCASRSPGAGCTPSCVVGWTIAPNGDHFGYNNNECTVTGGVSPGYHRVCCCSMGCFAPIQVP